MYVFAYDLHGSVIAHGGDPALVGKNLLGMHDLHGVPVIKDLIRLARGGSGWLYYSWPDPARGGQVEPELGYVKKVDDTWFLGSGTYGLAARKPPSRAEVRSLVDKALASVRQVGRDKAFAAFMDGGGPWFRGQLYVFADAFDGTVLCFPTEPDKVGANLWDRRDRDGAYPIRLMSRVARKRGAGWVTYKYDNPAQGFQVQQEYTYVRRGCGDWFPGSGTYRTVD